MSRKSKKTHAKKSPADKSARPQIWWPAAEPIKPLRQSPLRTPAPIAILILIAATAALNLAGIKWGLPNASSWNSDSIAGIKTVRMIPRLYKSWRVVDQQGNLREDAQGKPVIERYPRAQFFIVGNIYKPFLTNWKNNPMRYQDPRTGQAYTRWESVERISTLILISRIVAVIMAIGTVLGVFATTRLLCRDTLAAFLAAMVVMFSAEFTYFSHIGALDTPVTFWFIWTAYWVIRALQKSTHRYFILTGIFAGMVVCTKEASYGHLAGLAIFVIAAAIHHNYKQSKSISSIVKVICEKRLWLAFACFSAVFIIMNNVITDWPAFMARVNHWRSIKLDYGGGPYYQLQLLAKAFTCISEDCGLWMALALIASFIYCLSRHRIKLLWAIAPFVMFHLLVTIGALQVQARYHLPSLTCLAVMFGIAASDLLTNKRIPAVVRTIPLIAVLILAAMYAVAVDAEMIYESRYRAEDWIRKNVNKQRDVITFISPTTYMPRSASEGFNIRYSFENMTTAKSLQDRPKLIALADMWYMDPIHFDQDFRQKLLAGQLGYQKIAEFGPKFTPPAKGIFRIATLTTRVRQVVSPRIVFMERTE